MLDTRARALYDRWVTTPLVCKTALGKTNPQWITLLSCITGASVFFFLWQGLNKSACIALALSGLLDTLDGSIARHRGKTSPVGAVLDIVSDRCVELGVILGLFSISPTERAWPALLMLGSVLLCITSFLVVGIFTQNSSTKGFHYSPGFMERTEAFCFFAAMILFPGIFFVLSYAFAALVLWTACVRIIQFGNQS